MALAAAVERQSGKLVIKNIGLLLSGKLENPILEADTVVAEAGRITAVGAAKSCDTGGARVVIDAKGCALAPGLIDSHVHPVLGDWTPRQNQLGWIESCLNGGVTTMVSAGEVHTPGRPRDVVGVKALAVAAQRAYEGFRPAGVKLLAGAPVLEQGMEEHDFAELARSGVKLLGEVGLGTVKAGEEARRMVAWARKHGIQSTIHTGGPSVPGSGYIDADTVLEADADIIGHINGGHTALPATQIRCLCERCGRGIEIVHNGNELAGLTALRTGTLDWLRELDPDDARPLVSANPDLQWSRRVGLAWDANGRMDKPELPFKDLKVRQALNLAVDKQAYLKDYLKGQGVLLGYPYPRHVTDGASRKLRRDGDDESANRVMGRPQTNDVEV